MLWLRQVNANYLVIVRKGITQNICKLYLFRRGHMCTQIWFIHVYMTQLLLFKTEWNGWKKLLLLLKPLKKGKDKMYWCSKFYKSMMEYSIKSIMDATPLFSLVMFKNSKIEVGLLVQKLLWPYVWCIQW